MEELKEMNSSVKMQEDTIHTEVIDPYGFIYITTNLKNGKRYLGQKKFCGKWQDYIGSGVALKNAVKKYGKENFVKHIIDIAYSLEELNQKEYDYSVLFDVVESTNWYNLVYGGGTTTGMIASEETRLKLSQARKRNNIIHPEFNEHHSKKMVEFYKSNPKAKERMSNNTKELWKDPVYVDKVAQSVKKYWSDNNNRINRGKIIKKTWENPDVKEARLKGINEWNTDPEKRKIRSEIAKQNWEKQEYRDTQSKRNTGNKNPMYNIHRYGISSPRFIPVYCIELQKIFWGAKQAEQELHIKGSDIAQCCKNVHGHKSAGKHPVTGEKLHWLYAEDAIKQEYIAQQDLDEYLNSLKKEIEINGIMEEK